MWRGRLRRRTLRMRMLMMVRVAVPMDRSSSMRMIFVRMEPCPILFPRQILLAFHPDVDFGRRNPAARYPGNLKLCSMPQRCRPPLQQLRRHYGVHQGAQKHIAANPRKAL